MADNFQNSLLKAIDTLASYRIDQMDADKTVVATIVQCTNALTGEYLVKCDGGNMKAYAQGESTYSQDETVYVLVPKGDYTQKKMILSTMSSGGSDNLTFVTSVANDYNVIGGDIISKNGALPVGLNSYYKEDMIPLYLYDTDPPDGSPELIVNNEDLSTYIKQAQAILIQADFRTALPREHRKTTTGDYGIQIVCAFAGKDNPEEVTYTSYVLNVTSMVGNPYQYNNFTTQQAMFEVDAERFLYIDSIIAFSNNFVLEDDAVAADQWGDDIFVDNIQVYGLQEIAATSGDYMLKLSMPQGGIFKISGNQTPEDVVLSVLARVTYKVTQDLSQDTTFYWGKEDMEVDSLSEYYNAYLGSGWRYMTERGNNQDMSTNAAENVAHENKWICCAVYQEQVVLKQEFTLINQSAANNVKIESNLGTKFSFDRGEPILTCYVNDKASDFDTDNGYVDTDFRFVWARVDATSGTIILDRSAEDIQAAIDDLLDKGDYSYKEYAALKNKLSQVQNVEFSGVCNNIIKYPVGNITTSATFKCSVYRKRLDNKDIEDNIGTAEITLVNESAADASQYYILIENGDQVFQYSESGVSPASDRYTDPLEIKELVCHFYDQTHLEVNPDMYDLVWKFPTSSTMLVQPTENVIPNEANDGALEYYQGGPQRPYPLDIVDNYDYQALNNQITAIVTYDGQQFSQDTNFLFVKVGDNGTNGTDVVAKIVLLNNKAEVEDVTFTTAADQDKWGVQEALACLESRDGAIKWNLSQDWANCPTISSVALNMKLYRRNEYIADTKTRWQIAGGNTHCKNLAIGSDSGILSWGAVEKPAEPRYDNQIARGQVTLDSQDYYCFYPVVFSEYSTGAPRAYLDKYKTLKFVTYNADGHVPLYNKNQGVFFAKMPQDFTATFSVQGGVENDETTSAIKILAYDNNADTSPTNQPIKIEGKAGDMPGVYVYPDDVYSGATTNHNVIVNIKYKDDTTAKFIVPICLSLNTFGLASLNAWDGQHVEINEDENYVLAPQVGAGAKDENNRFTGILMGKMETYEQEDPSIGMLGFSHGKQSIWLDAQTGNAIFGLPDDQFSTDTQWQEGRIELIPGGESKIGMWRIGSHNLYNLQYVDQKGNTRGPLTIADNDPDNWENDWYSEGDLEKGRDDFPYRGDVPAPKGAQFSIPHAFGTGIILGSNPSYLSVKGKPLGDDDGLSWDSANQEFFRGDSLEAEIDANSKNIFTIYRHTNKRRNPETNEIDIVPWYRTPMVGINAEGKFYTNSLKDGESSMGIGFVGAFGQAANMHEFVGATFAYGTDNNILKFFQHANDDSTTYFSAGSYTSGDRANEYNRHFKFYATSFSLYADSSKNITEKSDAYLTLTEGLQGEFVVNQTKDAEAGTGSHIKMPVDGEFSLQSYGGPITLTATGSDNDIKLTGKNILETASESYTLSANQNVSLTATKGNILATVSGDNRSFKVSQGTSGNNITLDQDKFFSGTNDNHIQVNVSSSDNKTVSELLVNSPILFQSKTMGIDLKTMAPSQQIRLSTYSSLSAEDGDYSARIALTSAGDGASRIDMSAGGGASLQLKTFTASDGSDVNGKVGVQIAPLLVAESEMITDTFTTSSGDKWGLATSHGVNISQGDAPYAINIIGHTNQVGNSTIKGWITQYCGVNNVGLIQNQSNEYSEAYFNMVAITGANVNGHGLWVKHKGTFDDELYVQGGLVNKTKIDRWDSVYSWYSTHGWNNYTPSSFLASGSLNGYATQNYVNTAVSNLRNDIANTTSGYLSMSAWRAWLNASFMDVLNRLNALERG